uniref:TM2 domain-containing protein 1 isoform X2 n=1 Tax=Myxine glutinosa TaxID=7769 RepID=UPI00358F83A3
MDRNVCGHPQWTAVRLRPSTTRGWTYGSTWHLCHTVDCIPAPNITCIDSQGISREFDGETMAFQKSIICRNTSGYRYTVAVALSLFLGWLGADRFYLGYPALGLLKLCTIGFCGIGSLIDFVLIVTQVVGPSDGSSYIIDYYGARLTRLGITNETYRVPHTEL